MELRGHLDTLSQKCAKFVLRYFDEHIDFQHFGTWHILKSLKTNCKYYFPHNRYAACMYIVPCLLSWSQK